MDTLHFRTKGELVYEYVRQQILDGVYPPGSRVSISAIARELGVSDIPVREGIKRLEVEGLLDFETHKGAVVTRVTTDEIEELFAIRTELEALALQQAARMISQEQLIELRRLLDEMAQAETAGDTATYGTLNRTFHLAVYDAQPFRKLSAMIRNLWDSTDWCRRIFAADVNYLPASTAEHEGIWQALKEGDGDRAAEILRRQKQRARDWLLDHAEHSQDERADSLPGAPLTRDVGAVSQSARAHKG
jgi:DNA-binding GntR family transcriptional regulator